MCACVSIVRGLVKMFYYVVNSSCFTSLDKDYVWRALKHDFIVWCLWLCSGVCGDVELQNDGRFVRMSAEFILYVYF